MSVCRVDAFLPVRRLAAAGFLLTVLSAQGGSVVTPLEGEPWVPPATVLEAPPSKTSVQSATLAPPSPDAAGLLDEKRGGLPAALWHDTSATTVRALLTRLPVETPSHGVRTVARRLLSSAGAAPAADGGASLVAQRIDRLAALGFPDDAASLAAVVPAQAQGASFPRLEIDRALLSGAMDAACPAVARMLASAPDAELAKAQVLCQFVTGKKLEGGLALDLLRERKDADHPFIAAVEVLSGLPPLPVASLKYPTPVQLAAFRAAKMALPADAVDTAHPGLLAAIIASTATALDLRIAAVERAEAVGVLDTDTARRLLGEVAFTPEDLMQPLARAETVPGPRALALLVKAADAATEPSVRLALIVKALDLAQARGRAATAARLLAPLAATIKPGPEVAAAAAPMARLLLLAGRTEGAAKWLDLARANGSAAPLELVARLAGLDAAQAAKPAAAADRRAAVALALLSALGERVGDEEWLPHLALPAEAGANAALWHLLDGAVRSRRIGATLLAGLASLGDGPLAKAEPVTLHRVTAALKAAGLEKDARRFAVEAALANGLMEAAAMRSGS